MNNLPIYSHEQKLENKSFNRIKLILEDTDDFLVGKNSNYDYGVDFNIELVIGKENPSNHQLNCQLKAIDKLEEKAKNKDGSYSIQIDSSNINFLLATVSLYILFVKSEDKLYFLWTDDVFVKLMNKNSDWLNKKAKHTIRFYEEITNETLKRIHSEGLQKLNSLKQLRLNQILVSNATLKTSCKIILDAETLESVTDSNLIQHLEEHGITLTNQGYSQYIIDISASHTRQIEENHFVCFILGFANSNTGNQFQALYYLQKVLNSEKLDSDYKNYARFLYHSIRKSIGAIDNEQFKEDTKELIKHEPLSFYISLDTLKNKFLGDPANFFNEYISSLESIIKKSKYPLISLQARCDKMYANGWKKNQNYIANTSRIEAMETQHDQMFMELRQANVYDLINELNAWSQEANSLREDILQNGNHLLYASYIQIYSHISIRHLIISSIVRLSRKSEDFEGKEIESDIEASLGLIDEAIRINRHYSHKTNLCVCLSTKIEILDYHNLPEKLDKVLEEINTLSRELADPHFIKQAEELSKGNTYRKLLLDKDEQVKTKYAILKEREEKAYLSFREIHDKEEEHILAEEYSTTDEEIIIHIFKVGFYIVHKDRLVEFAKILGFDKNTKLIDQLKFMALEVGVIPRLNVIQKEILEEGFGEGNMSFKGIEDNERWAARKKLIYENGFKRIKDQY